MPESDLFPDIDPGDPISDETKIIRYMNLQAFMTLLAGRVFIPSVKKLQETDPLESLLPSGWIGRKNSSLKLRIRVEIYNAALRFGYVN
jgi:hypothetical protein